VLLDLDHFKRLNDQHGHLAGDEALVAVAQEILETIRNADVAGRLGGEEFLVVAPYTDVAGAGLLAERLRTRIQQTTLSQTDQSLTASFGIAMLGEEDTVAHALARADRALRTAKQEGRNRVAIDPIALHAGER
jgi:diguanylate cyclase (GGDEF)-like protein